MRGLNGKSDVADCLRRAYFVLRTVILDCPCRQSR